MVSNQIVLIETYWNVNVDSFHKNTSCSGINRNILECKLKNSMEVMW